MKTLSTILVISSLLFSMPAIAGSGHNHGQSHTQKPVNQATAEKNAEKVIASLVESNKVDKSWVSITASSAEKKELKGSLEWVVIFINDKIADTDKRKLYVFLTSGGEYIAANYTGK